MQSGRSLWVGEGGMMGAMWEALTHKARSAAFEGATELEDATHMREGAIQRVVLWAGLPLP